MLSKEELKWYTPQPMSQEDQQREVLSSRVVQPHDEFTPEDQKKVLQELNIGTQYDDRNSNS